MVILALPISCVDATITCILCIILFALAPAETQCCAENSCMTDPLQRNSGIQEKGGRSNFADSFVGGLLKPPLALIRSQYSRETTTSIPNTVVCANQALPARSRGVRKAKQILGEKLSRRVPPVAGPSRPLPAAEGDTHAQRPSSASYQLPSHLNMC